MSNLHVLNAEKCSHYYCDFYVFNRRLFREESQSPNIIASMSGPLNSPLSCILFFTRSSGCTNKVAAILKTIKLFLLDNNPFVGVPTYKTMPSCSQPVCVYDCGLPYPRSCNDPQNHPSVLHLLHSITVCCTLGSA